MSDDATETAKLYWQAGDRVRLKLKANDIALNAVYDVGPLPDVLTLLDDDGDPIANASFVDIQQNFSIEFNGTRYHFKDPCFKDTLEQVEFKPLDHPASVAPLDKVSAVKGWRREAGETTQPVLFLREHLVEQAEELDNFFTSTEKMKLYVTGAPGSGKTTFFLLYAFKRVTEKNERALVVQYRQSEICEIMVFSKGSIVRLSQELSSGVLFTAMQQVLEQDTAGFDFFVFDGVRQSLDVCQSILGHLNTCFTLQHGKNGRKGIHITSLQFVIKDGDGGRKQAKRVTIQSWRLAEYRSALVAKIKSTEEWRKLLDDESDRASAAMEEEDDMDVDDGDSSAEVDSEALLEMLERKFYYGGGSVRFMFEYTMSELLEQLKSELLPQVNSKMWEDYAKLSISSKTASAVNTLMQVLPTEEDSGNNYFPVSKYILHKAHEMCGEALVNSAKAVAASSRNPVLWGWAFELEQIELINAAMKSSKFVLSQKNELVLPTSTLDVIFDGDGIVGNWELDTFAIKCLKWNQGCFDIAFYCDGTLITLQFTVSPTHNLKIGYLCDLRKALQDIEKTVTSVKHIGVVENQSVASNFKFNEAEGNGTGKVLFRVDLARSTKLCESLDKIAAQAVAARAIYRNVSVKAVRRSKRRKRRAGELA